MPGQPFAIPAWTVQTEMGTVHTEVATVHAKGRTVYTAGRTVRPEVVEAPRPAVEAAIGSGTVRAATVSVAVVVEKAPISLGLPRVAAAEAAIPGATVRAGAENACASGATVPAAMGETATPSGVF